MGGVTIHRLFQLPIEHEGREAGYWSLPKAAQKVMKTALRSLKVLIIDEVSMVSSLNLAYIHMRLEELLPARASEQGNVIGLVSICVRTYVAVYVVVIKKNCN